MSAKKRKVLLIGWDAADWKVISPLMDAGKMPHLESLVNEGVMGKLSTLTPVLSPMLWTTIATGKRPYKHGILGFAEPDPERGGARPITNLSRKTKAVWNILGQNDLKTNVIGWWPSHPTEPINGVMVSNHFQKSTGPSPDDWPMMEGAVHPPELAETLKQFRVHPSELDAGQILPFVRKAAEIDVKEDPRLAQVANVLSHCAGVHACSTAVMQNEEWDFMAIYHDAIDHFCHGFMKFHPPKLDHVDERSFELYHEVVESAYRFHDLMLGSILKLIDDDTTVIVMSDHGFHPDHLRPKEIPHEPNGPAIEHSPYGIFVARGPGIKKDETVFGASLLDITPTLLRLFDLPVGEDMDGRVLTSIFEDESVSESIPSWDEIEGDDGRHPPHFRYSPEDDRALMQQLVDLGYVEEQSDNKEVATRESLRELQFNLARSYVDADLHGDSIPVLEKLVEEWPDEFRFLNQLAFSYLSMDLLPECRKTTEKLVALQARLDRSVVEQLPALEAQVAGRPLNELEPGLKKRYQALRQQALISSAPLHLLLGGLLTAEGESEKALQVLELISEESWKTPILPLRVGQIKLALKQYDGARYCFERALEIDPQCAQAHRFLMQLLLEQGLYREAAEQGFTTVGLLYFQPIAHQQIGQAFVGLKLYQDAESAFRVALSQAPTMISIHEHLAELYDRHLASPTKADRHYRLASEMVQKRAEIQKRRKEGLSKDSKEPLTAEGQLAEKLSERLVIPEDWKEEEIITIVSGLPRSGTSMMMQMLDAGGLAPFTDQLREADENNPRGYYELEGVKELHKDQELLKFAVGKVVKVVAPLIPKLPLDQGYRYRIIFMERDLDEVHASQATMLGRLGKEPSQGSAERMKESFVRLLAQVNQHLEVAEIPLLTVAYSDAISSPGEVARSLNDFCGGGLDETLMSSTVDPSLYRERLT